MARAGAMHDLARNLLEAFLRSLFGSLSSMNQSKRELSAGPHFAAAAALLTGLGATPLVHATWDVVPEIELGIYTEDNPRMNSETFVVTETNQNATSMELNAGLDLATISERSLLRFFPSITSYRYTDEANADLE